jgi:hypothetical protein
MEQVQETDLPSPTDNCRQCEKYSKKEEALEKLRGGAKFDDVAREFSEDKARQGSFKSSKRPCMLHVIEGQSAVNANVELSVFHLPVYTQLPGSSHL